MSVEIQCSSCGSQLTVAPEDATVICNQCGTVNSGQPPAALPDLMNELEVPYTPSSISLAEDTGPHLPELSDIKPPPPPPDAAIKKPAASPHRKAKTKFVLTGSIAFVAICALLYFSPLGIILGLRENPAPPVKQTNKVVAAPTPTPPIAEKPKEEPAPPLSWENVDSLSFVHLQQATAHLTEASPNSEAQKLLGWANYRLYSSFNIIELRDSVSKLPTLAGKAKLSPAKILAAHDHQAVIYFSALLVQGKAALIRKTADKIKLTGEVPPQLLFVLAQAYRAPGSNAAHKALEYLERCIEANPQMLDARLLYAEILTDYHDASLGVRTAIEIAQGQNADTVVRVAQLLLTAGIWHDLSEVVDNLRDATELAGVAPSRQDLFLKLLVRKMLRVADLKSALKISEKRRELMPYSTEIILEHGSLIAALHGDSDIFFNQLRSQIQDADARARTWLQQIRIALEQKTPDKAKALVKQATAQLPAAQLFYIRYGEALIASEAEDREQVTKILQSIVSTSPNFALAKLDLLLQNKHRLGQNLSTITQLARQAELGMGPYRLATTMETLGNSEGAAQLMERVLWESPTLEDPIDLIIHWIDLIDQAGDHSNATKAAETIHKNMPDDDRGLLELIKICRRAAQYDDAINWYKVLLGRHPNHFEYTTGLAATLVDMKRPNDGQRLLENLLKIAPEARSAPLLLQLGRAWVAQDVVIARGFFVDSIKLKASADAYIQIAVLEEERGKTDEALEAYHHALEIDPDLLGTRMRMIRLLIQKARVAEASSELRKLLEKYPKHPEAAELLGDAQREMGNSREAVAAYAISAEADPKNPSPLVKMSRLQLQELSQVGPAVKTLRRLIKLDPKNAEAFYQLGYALRDMGKNAEGKTMLENYLRLSPQGEFANDVRSDLRVWKRHK